MRRFIYYSRGNSTNDSNNNGISRNQDYKSKMSKNFKKSRI